MTIIVPAHNEEAVAGACLESLCGQARHGPAQVVVVLNDCTDGTAAVVQAYVGALEACGFQVRVLRLNTQGSCKRDALNAGDAVACFGHRVYLDADVVLSPGALSAIERAFARDVLFCSPQIMTVATGYASRAYGSIWSRLPYVRDDVLGAGLYAVHRQGRRRWRQFPDVMSDDKFARLQFAREERLVLQEAFFVVRLPVGLRELVTVRARWIRGNWQLRQRFPHLVAGDRRRWRDAIAFVGREPGCWRDVPMVAAVYGLAEVRALLLHATGTVRWEQATRARAVRRGL